MNAPVRIAMWSGPRNISTAMMRAFENRSTAVVVDEPFYAAYLAQTDLDHPLRDAVLKAQSTDWTRVVADLMAPLPLGATLQYQKHMTHHMLPGVGLDWLADCRNAFLIRDPTAVLASYAVKRAEVTLADIGVERQRELFEREADRLGWAPPVVEGADILTDPPGTLTRLCTALDIEFDPAMLAWPAGPRQSDGVWAPAWYDTVRASTGFGPGVRQSVSALPTHLQRIADAAMGHYERLAGFKL